MYDEKSLSDEATFAGAAKRRPTAEMSLGDERTLGDRLGDQDTVIDDIEVVDLEARYKVEKTLGRGGMGEVLLALDTRLNRKVAIKRILGEAARSSTAIARFLTEARAIAAISHPHVIQIYELGVAVDGPFLIIEYIDGGSLLDRCQAGPLPTQDTVTLVCQVCDGLAKAHDLGIVHRDIKPANVLITRDGIAKLTDFGLAKAESSDQQMTIAGSVMGTPDFMPPEQRRDAALVDHRSDLWSLAATLYQAVTGRSPKVIRLHELPQELQPIISKALEDDKEARYQSATELRDALRGTLRAEIPTSQTVALNEGQCPACRTQNDSRRKFCRGCGESLEAPCLACSEPMLMWDEICGSCGAKQTPLEAAKRDELIKAQSQATALLDGCEFERAESIANTLRKERSPRFSDIKSWAERFSAEVQNSKNKHLAQVVEAVEQALAHEHAFDYAAGVRALEAVPTAVRLLPLPGADGTAGDVYDRLQQKAATAVALEKTIRDAVAARNLVGLLPQVIALADLRPDRADIAKLREQLETRARAIAEQRDAALGKARDAYARKDYALAVKLLEQIGAEGTNDEVEQLANDSRLLEAQSLSLRQQIIEATAVGRLDGLLELIDEYCAIKPTTPELTGLRAKAAEHAERIAEKARVAARRKRLMVMAAGVVLGFCTIAGVAAKLWRAAAVERAAKAQLAVEEERWDDALDIEPENVAALVGRARTRLQATPPDIDGAFEDLDRAGRFGGSHDDIATVRATAHAVQALERARGQQPDAVAITTLAPTVVKALPPLRNSIGIELKLLPAGTFTMGQAEGDSDETPHQVTLTKPFYIGVYEVTNAQWKRVMGSVPSNWKDDDLPVEYVSWEDTVEFCRKLSSLPEEVKAGRVYRLPTEAEWEYACRAGTSTEYSFGDDTSLLGDYARYDRNSGDRTHPAGQKKPNAWSLYDMHGNVWEWCSDWYEAYPKGPVTDPRGPSRASGRVHRGGSWGNTAGNCRSAIRFRYGPSIRTYSLGFRLALSPSEVQPVSPEAGK